MGGDVWCSKQCFGRDNHVIMFDEGQEKTDEQHRQEVEHELSQALLQVWEAEVPLPDNPINHGKPPNRSDYLPGGREHKRVIPAMRRFNKAADALRRLEGLPERQHPSEISYAAASGEPAANKHNLATDPTDAVRRVEAYRDYYEADIRLDEADANGTSLGALEGQSMMDQRDNAVLTIRRLDEEGSDE